MASIRRRASSAPRPRSATVAGPEKPNMSECPQKDITMTGTENDSHNGHSSLPTNDRKSRFVVPRKRGAWRKGDTQEQILLDYLATGRTITPSEGVQLIGCKDASATVCRLRQAGWTIHSEKHRSANGDRI